MMNIANSSQVHAVTPNIGQSVDALPLRRPKQNVVLSDIPYSEEIRVYTYDTSVPYFRGAVPLNHHGA
jgi:hypothetical protein